jgi:hypothetical protein
VRLALEYRKDDTLVGATSDEQARTDPNLLFNVDASSSFLGKALEESKPVRLAKVFFFFPRSP